MQKIIDTIKFSLKKSTRSYIAGGALAACLLASSVSQAAFEGLISPTDAFEWASNDDSIFILDVRTGEEWMWVGHPGPNALVGSKNGKAKGLNYNEGAGLAGKVANIASMIQKDDKTGGLKLNPDFVFDVLWVWDEEAEEYVQRFDPSTDTLLVICRSGGRAEKAAIKLGADDVGFTTYNIADGFQGPSNNEDDPGRDTGYRDVSGWVNDGLPWNQSKVGGYYSQ